MQINSFNKKKFNELHSPVVFVNNYSINSP